MLYSEEMLQGLLDSEDLKPCDFTRLINATEDDVAFIITDGELLLQDKRILDSGLTATHRLYRGAPIWFAETITKRRKQLNFKELRSVSLNEVEGSRLRRVIDQSGFLAKEICRYSLARVFGREKDRRNFVFEDHLYSLKGDLQRVYYKNGDVIYDCGESPKAMYFIVDGAVSLKTLRNKTLTQLKASDSFGEYSLLTSTQRSLRAEADTDCQLLKLGSEWVEDTLKKEHPLVRLCINQLVTRLSINNQINLISTNDGVFCEVINIED